MVFLGFYNVLKYSTQLYNLYNDTAQHAIPMLVNTHSNTYSKLYGAGMLYIDNVLEVGLHRECFA